MKKKNNGEEDEKDDEDEDEWEDCKALRQGERGGLDGLSKKKKYKIN